MSATGTSLCSLFSFPIVYRTRSEITAKLDSEQHNVNSMMQNNTIVSVSQVNSIVCITRVLLSHVISSDTKRSIQGS